MTHRRHWQLAVLALGFVGCACGVLLGIDEYGAANGGTDAAAGTSQGIRFASKACGTCASGACSREVSECAANPDCRSVVSCYFGCGDTDRMACLFACTEHATTGDVARRALGCILDSCGTTCAGCGDLFAPFGTACGECARNDRGAGELCELQNACLSDPACRGYLACLEAECDNAFIADPKCRLTCGNRFPVGARSFYQKVGSRYFDACATKCDGGRQWQCVTQVWPAVTGGTATVTLGRADGAGDGAAPWQPIVRACFGMTEQSCTPPLSGDFVRGGTTTFELQQGRDPQHYFELVDPDSAPPSTLLLVPWTPIVGDTTVFVPPVPPDAVPLTLAAANALGVKADFVDSGAMIVTVADCVGGLADFRSLNPEITISTSPPGAAVVYYEGFFPSPTARGGGQSIVVNLPPGLVGVEVRRGTEVIARAAVPCRAGAVTWVMFNHPQYF